MDDLKTQFINKMKFSKQQIDLNFVAKVKVSICPQKCPCCGRICGREGSHTIHQCVYGHQVRAFAGTKFKNGKASVYRCEDMKDCSRLIHNGQPMTWKQFIDLQTGRGWNFDDLANKDDERQKLFLFAWKQVGKHFCDKFQMTYTEYNNAFETEIGNIHFIIAIDQSGSMNDPGKWSEVIKTLNQMLPILKSLPNYEQTVKISTLLLSGTCRTYQSNVSPNNTNFNIKPNWGGTKFAPTFQTAYQIMNANHQNSNIMFILLTDGAAEFPASQIKLIKQLKANTKSRIMYSGIEFQCTSSIMNQIKTQLDGKNFTAYTQQQLLGALTSAVEIIRSK